MDKRRNWKNVDKEEGKKNYREMNELKNTPTGPKRNINNIENPSTQL
jgi:hypothetical protein